MSKLTHSFLLQASFTSSQWFNKKIILGIIETAMSGNLMLN
jgi:hypothetical protein